MYFERIQGERCLETGELPQAAHSCS